MLRHYGSFHGLRIARKHVGWYLETSGVPAEIAKDWRSRLCRLDEAEMVLEGLGRCSI